MSPVRVDVQPGTRTNGVVGRLLRVTPLKLREKQPPSGRVSSVALGAVSATVQEVKLLVCETEERSTTYWSDPSVRVRKPFPEKTPCEYLTCAFLSTLTSPSSESNLSQPAFPTVLKKYLTRNVNICPSAVPAAIVSTSGGGGFENAKAIGGATVSGDVATSLQAATVTPNTSTASEI